MGDLDLAAAASRQHSLVTRRQARDWQPLMAACLAAGPCAVASHRSAAVLWGMPGIVSEQPRRPDLFNPGGSGAELDLLAILVGAGLPPPVQQHQVVVGDTVYVLDDAYPDVRLDIEYDGWMYHRLPTDLDRAAARNNALELAGWRVLQFTAASGPSQIVAQVAAARAQSARAVGGHDPHLREKKGMGSR